MRGIVWGVLHSFAWNQERPARTARHRTSWVPWAGRCKPRHSGSAISRGTDEQALGSTVGTPAVPTMTAGWIVTAPTLAPAGEAGSEGVLPSA